MRTLLIELPPSNTPADRHVRLAWVQRTGRTEPGGTHDLAEALAHSLQQARKQEAFQVVAVLPETRVSWHSVALPARLPSEAKKRQAMLQGLIEPSVLGEIQALHLALMPNAQAGGTAWVMACDRTWLSEVLAQLKHWDVQPTRLIPASCPPPPDTALRWQARDLSGQAWLVVAGTNAKGQGVFERWLATTALLPLLVERHGTDVACLWAEPAAAQVVQSVWPQVPVQLKEAHEQWHEVLQTPWDVAQFDFQLKGWKHMQTRCLQTCLSLWQDRAWRPLRLGLLACVLAQLVGMALWLGQARSQLSAVAAQQKQVLLTVAPQTTLVLDAPAQLAQLLAQEQRRQGQLQSDDFESLMNVAQQVIATGQTPTRIDYQDGQLKLAGLASPDPGLIRRARSMGVELQVQQDVWTLRVVSLGTASDAHRSSP
jgi:general secretion pathway protein L